MFSPRSGLKSPEKDRSPRSPELLPGTPSPQRSPRLSAAEVTSPRAVLALLRPRAGTDRSLAPGPSPSSAAASASPAAPSAPPPLPPDPPGVRQWKVHLKEGTLASERLSGTEGGAEEEEEEEDMFEFSLSSDSGQLGEAALLPVARVEQTVFGDLDERLEGLLALLFGAEAVAGTPEPSNGLHWVLRLGAGKDKTGQRRGPPRVLLTVTSREVVLLLPMQHVAAHAPFVRSKVADKIARALAVMRFAREAGLGE